jgi:hypothetical protein
MSQHTAGQIQEIGGRIEEFAGIEVRQKVMQGSELAAATSNMTRVSLWVKESMDRLDSLADPETRRKIMNACGHNCCRHNIRMVQTRKARRQKFATEEEFLKAEVKNPAKGTRLEIQGNLLLHSYTPHTYSTPRRCFCSLMCHLPEDVQVSPTYCQCACGFMQEYWETILGRPVRVEVLTTAISGAPECQFQVFLK